MRVSVFIDGKNFYRGWQDRAVSHQLDFVKMSDWIVKKVKGNQLWGVFYYVGIETGVQATTQGQKSLAKFLRDLELLPGYFVRRFTRKAMSTRCRSCNAQNRFTQEKEVDTTMVADMLRLAAVNAFDAMVLISGDRDHLPGVEGVQALGKKAYVASWGGRGLAGQIRSAVFDHIDLLAGIPEFEIPPVSSPQAPQRRTLPPQRTNQDSSAATNVSEIFIRELKAAEAKFSPGFVGLNYFLRKWTSVDLDPSPETRGRILDKLEKENRISVYQASNGDTAIKTVKQPPAPIPATPPEPSN